MASMRHAETSSGWLVALACAAFVLAPAPAFAARTDNAAATRAYLRASEEYARSVAPELGAMTTAAEARASEIAARCPSVLTYAPRDPQLGELEEEIGRSLWYASFAPVRSVTLRLAGAIGRLRWTDRKLTRLVRAQAVEERAILGLALPEACAQMEAWKASDYATLPSSVSGFLEHAHAIESSSTVGRSEESREKVIMRLLRRYEGPAERRIAGRIERLSAQEVKRLSARANAVGTKLAASLGVSEL